MVLDQEPNAKTCASLVLRLDARPARWSEAMPRHADNFASHALARLLRGFQFRFDVVRSRAQGLPNAHVIDICKTKGAEAEVFETKMIWSPQ